MKLKTIHEDAQAATNATQYPRVFHKQPVIQSNPHQRPPPSVCARRAENPLESRWRLWNAEEGLGLYNLNRSELVFVRSK